MNAEYLSQVGRDLVKRCGTRDPFRIAKELGIEVMFCEDFGRLKGMYMLKGYSKMNCSQAQGFLQWAKIRRLYKKAFPRAERKPLSIIKSMQKSRKSDVCFFEKDGRFVGFASTINGDEIILLDYLAVDTACRGMGIGSEILQALRQQYTGKGVFAEIERVKEDADASDHRRKRKQFYITNGMTELDVTAKVFGVEMELMGWDCYLDFDAYQSFYRNYYSEFAAKNLVPISKE